KTYRVGVKYTGLPCPTRSGYLCTGWYTSAQGGSRSTGAVTASTSHKKFYAHWARAVTIAFDPNKGTCSTAKKTFRVGVKYADLPTPTRANYLFTGWFTAAEGGTRIDANTTASSSHKKFYAHWRRAVTVSFNPNGGTCSVKQKKYGISLPYGSFPSTTRSGYAFMGWFTPEGTHVRTNSTVTAARTNLVAHWNKNLGIHPVGDSMTYGVRTRNNPLLNGASASAVAQIGNQGWRGYLKKTLVPWGKTKNRAVLFLGKHPQSSYKGNVPHDGYCGEYASAYASKHADACAVKADVQIVFLGMNDALAISRKSNPASHVASLKDGYGKVLSALHAGSTTPLTILITEPKVTSLISKRNSAYNPSAINNVITGYINPFVRSKKGSKIKILDIESLYSNASYTDDGFHLSDAGNRVLSERLAKLVEDSW
ncbi:MAG: InlB B-repeat-containing protein, partial [Kiritimatiellae bacterium]|nr:InlB B-repeat-containing protein [Kiritimatiellia bacterium]